MQDTIYALSTVAAKSGVAVIRISGPKALDALPYFSFKDTPKPRLAYYTDFVIAKTDEMIDSGLLLYFKAPYSFTGEEVLEIQCHGSMAVIKSFLSHLSNIPNYRMAEPGEFSRRAFDNGKMDLTQAEGLADLIESETEAQRLQAVRQMQGHLGGLYESWRMQLIDIIAYLEAYIDFPDEDLPDSLTLETGEKLSNLISSISEHLHDNQIGEKLRQGLQVVIAGPPNAGKSSFLNYIAKRDVAIVSAEAGTTRDLVEVHLDLAGIPVTLIDTAGLRDTEHQIEREGVSRAQDRLSSADIRIILFDAKDMPTMDDAIFSLLDGTHISLSDSLLCLNKIDQVTGSIDVVHDLLPSPYQAMPYFPLSVHNEQGIDALLEALTTLVLEKASLTDAPAITRERHREALKSCLARLEAFTFTGDLVLAVEDLRLAAQFLGKITGRIDAEDILDALFSHFCIGK